MRMRFRLLLAAVAIAATGTAGLAREAPVEAAAAGDIVVTAIQSRDVSQTALAVTAPGNLRREPLARFQMPVCPGVIGMDAKFAELTVARIRDAARRARVRVAPDKCEANLLVMVMPSGQAALQNLLHRRSSLFGNLTRADLKDLAQDPALKDLAADPGPVHAWVNTETRSRFGDPMTGLGTFVEPSLIKIVGAAPSHIHMNARRDIVSALVVIDTAAVEGMSVHQIADYAAMRGLVRTQPPGKSGEVGTILSLFDNGALPLPEMTRFDRAYLEAAYSSRPDIPAAQIVGRVAHAMGKVANTE